MTKPKINQRIETHPEGQVAYVELANEAKRNAIGPDMIAQLRSVFLELAGNENLRAVVLSGAGDRAFAAGADVKAMARLNPESERQFITGLHLAIDAIGKLPVPVIAKIHGFCFGAAVEIAARCDFRLGDTTTLIGMPEVKVGIPSVIEAALLPRIIGDGKAREMLLTGMTYDAEAAFQMRFLDGLFAPDDLDAQVAERVSHILESAPGAVQSQRALLYAWEQMSLDDSIALSIDHFEAAFETDEPATYLARVAGPKRE